MQHPVVHVYITFIFVFCSGIVLIVMVIKINIVHLSS